MLYAAISRPPAFGGKLINVDKSKAEAISGVKVIVKDDLVAALHANPNVAEKAQEVIIASWNVPEAKVNDKTIFEY